jgi:octaheme c-type cytochrome (tetrathionate reductase family)
MKVLGWLGAGVAGVAVLSLAAVGLSGSQGPSDDPWANVVEARPHFDHSPLFNQEFQTGQEVTAACLQCHEDEATELMTTAHWRWLGDPVSVPGHQGEHRLGKANLLNNFCIGIRGNEPSCTRCHAGYGWEDDSFDFTDTKNMDCLVCHDRSGTYQKGAAGLPKPGVDLLASAKSVGFPKRDNCGVCHSFGGGGLGVKHGDLDNSFDNPSIDDDVHMGGAGLLCIDCHGGSGHKVRGNPMSVSPDMENRVSCTDCHLPKPHDDPRLNSHVSAVACETCHIPSFANKVPTKMWWDWSKAGDDSREDDPHVYMKIKGEFRYSQNVTPEYYWFNRTADRYLVGDKVDPSVPIPINKPRGDISDAAAKIHPFKVHRGTQPFDSENGYLLPPVTAGEGGYWREFDWPKALRLGAALAGLEFSGSYSFAETEMYWPMSHMVKSGRDALKCSDCHGESGRMDWEALGYGADPMKIGGRDN